MIGVSIAIPPPHGDLLQAKRASFGDPLADSIPTHVTLLGPTEVSDEDMPAAVEHLEAVSAISRPFPMVLRGTGTFRPISPVVFVQVSGGLAECEVLERAVRTGPLEKHLDFYYHPHVTVAHHVSEASLDRAFSSSPTSRHASRSTRSTSTSTARTRCGARCAPSRCGDAETCRH